MVYKKRVSDRKYKNGPAEIPVLRAEPISVMHNHCANFKCRLCATTRSQEEFPKLTMFEPDLYFTDSNGEKRSYICTYCCSVFLNHLTEKNGGDIYLGLYRLCSLIGLYYDDDVAHKVYNEEGFYEDGSPVSEYIPKFNLYLRYMQDNEGYHKTFMNERCIPFDRIVGAQYQSIGDENLNEQATRDRNEIIEKFHYDPFDKEPFADRGRLYSDLLTLYDEAMVSDLVRQRAAIEIVKSFYRIDCIGRTIQELQQTTSSMVENSKTLKELIDQKKKETDMVTAFSKDHGFAERYQMAKAKGAGTLSNIVREGLESKFDRLAVNFFDIKTAKAMQQVADMSAAAMTNQIQLGADDFRDMVDKQATEIRDLTQKVESLQEANRLLREKQVKQELMKEYVEDLKEKGIDDPAVVSAALEKASVKTYYSRDGEPS